MKSWIVQHIFDQFEKTVEFFFLENQNRFCIKTHATREFDSFYRRSFEA